MNSPESWGLNRRESTRRFTRYRPTRARWFRDKSFSPCRERTLTENRFVDQALEKGAVAAVTRADAQAVYACPIACIPVENTLAALQAFAAYHRAQHNIPLFALTGSCGKTTTKDLTFALLATKYRVIKTHGNFEQRFRVPALTSRNRLRHGIRHHRNGRKPQGRDRRPVRLGPSDRVRRHPCGASPSGRIWNRRERGQG